MDIVIDTNVILHFRRLEELDWCGLVGAASCSLIVTPVMMRELERNKVHNSNAKLRQRAGEAIAWFADRLQETHPIRLRKGVTLVFDDQEPLIDFAEHRLSRDMADDHLIASALDWAQRSGQKVAIATVDSGIALKLRSRPISCLQPPNEWRLPDAADAERSELRELRRQLDHERNRRPTLTVHFEGDGKTIAVTPEPIEPPRSLKQVRGANSPMSLDEFIAADDRPRLGPRVYESTRVDTYNRAREAFFAEYEIYLRKHAKWMDQEKRTIELAFSLANLGSAPASNIDVNLAFPSHVEIMAAEDGPEEPEEPQAPQRPHPNRASVLLGRAISLPSALLGSMPQIDGEPQISRDRRAVDYHFRTLKHECASDLDPVLVLFASYEQMKPFEITVSITCNETDKVVEKLVVVLAQG